VHEGLLADGRGDRARSVAGAGEGDVPEALDTALRLENQAGFPPWSQHARLQKRTGSVVALESSEGDPLLGLMPRGLGWSALWASAPDWSPAWEGKFRSLIRLLGRASSESPRSRLAILDSELSLELPGRSIPAAIRGRFVHGAGGELGSVLFTPPPHAQSESERRASIPDFLFGAGMVEVRLEDVRTGAPVGTLAIPAPAPEEFYPGKVRPGWLARAPRPASPSTRASRPEGLLMLGCAAVLVFLAGWTLARARAR
jgi:hypothetical protein